MKISIYTICKNESKFVDRFLDFVLPELREGDDITICDTGSTDGTVELFRNRGVNPYVIHVNPWRFDVARNTALSLVPIDVDICLAPDLDEFLQPGWRAALEREWEKSAGKMTRVRYDYIWSWKDDGSPGTRFFADKIHHRRNYMWRHPCHETLYWVGPAGEDLSVTIPDLALHHHADNSKSRGSYLGLLEIAVKEDPLNDRMQHYYARELYFNGRQVEASEWFQKHLDNPNSRWRHERSQSMIYLSKLNGNDAWKVMWAYRAAAECPERREVWWNLHDRELDRGNVLLADEFRKRAESIPFDGFYLSDGR
jgi:glycosyltransferase involved in cell wall biosynthesis